MALRLALDTNRYTDLCRGEVEVIAAVESAAAILLPFIVMAELRAGFARGTQGPRNEAVLHRFLMKEVSERSLCRQPTTQYYATLYQQLRTQGTPIPTNHMWIAALAVQHSLVVYARDAHFDHLPQLVRV